MIRREKLLKKWRTLAAMFFLAAFASNMQAQNVTIKATNGSTIAARKSGGTEDTFFGLGGFATWQHEQLSMVLTVSDGTALTPNMQLDNPANNLFANGDYMQIAKGRANGANVCYATISLPKGYRFTGYTIQFTKPRNAQSNQFNTANGEQSTFGETGSTFGTYTTQATITTNGAAQTISRTGMGEGDMGNVLYFKLQGPTDSRALIQLESAEFFFTAEENYSPVTPAGTIASPVSAVNVPFSTSKVDYGPITNTSYGSYGRRISYGSSNVKDLEANFVLYEKESVEAGSDIDGVSGDVVKFGSGTISSDGGYFKLGREGSEQVYYLETPTSVTLSDGTKTPVGYRIVGAEIEYANQITASRTFRIAYTTTGYYPTTYYLNTDGRFTTTQTTWEMDAEGYISSNGYYLYFNNAYASTQRSKPAASERFGIDENNNIYQLQWPTYFITYYAQQGGWGGTTRYGLISNTSGQKATYQEISTSTETLDFTLNVYDKTGENIYATKIGGSGKVTLSGLNNDAVKFGVKGIGLVRATLTLQALDPYLDKMSVVCQDEQEKEIHLDQTFTASDFSVSGGEFYFYLPEEAKNHQVAITFENLVSKYFDETYDGGDAKHTSRINFVKSDHYNAFGESNNSLYKDVSEAANAQKERLKVGIVGTQPFKFNNADEVGTSGGTLTEYPFSLEKYAAAPNNGSFGDMKFTVTTEDQKMTRYVFTTDETRYNIAPTTATQHRAYAFYTMTVHVQTATYEPKVKFTKVYDKTLYRDDDGNVKTDAFYGVEVTAVDGNGNPGYASTNKIFEIIEHAIAAGKDDFDNTDLPTGENGSKQILYLDFSKLKGIYMITDESHESMEAYSNTNAANCLIFLPAGSSAPNNNVAAKQSEESAIFTSANDIVLTDMQPFYSPYDIQVIGHKISYERKVTVDKNGKVQNASLILPFIITVEDGKHTNEDGTSFTLHTMQPNNALKVEDDKAVAFFPVLSGNVTVTEANKPYLVQLSSNSTKDNVSFEVTQTGGLIAKTAGDNYSTSGYTLEGESASGIVANGGNAAGTYTFKHEGTYAGIEVSKDDNVFYFAKNMFVSSKDLADSYSTAKIAPFRAFYATTSTGSAKLSSFEVIFDEGEGDTTGVFAVDAAGVIDVNAPVFDLQGRMVAPAYRELNGKLSRGIYVVNGVKVIVK